MKSFEAKKVTAIVLLISMLISVSACSGDKDDKNLDSDNKNTGSDISGESDQNTDDENAPKSDNDANKVEQIPLGFSGVKYDGETFVIEAVDNRTTVYQAIYNPFSIEETNGDLLNDTVYAACSNVEELLGLKLKQTFSASVHDYGRLKIAVSTGDGSVDAYSYIDRFGTNQASGGCVIPYEKIPNINLSNPWWFSEVNEAISIGGHYCFAIGAMNLDVVSNMQCMLFNKNILTSNQLDDPYDLVRSGKWTIDTLYSMIETITDDTNGDGKMDVDDMWGAVYTHDVWYNNFGPVSGSYIVEKDADDLPVFMVTGNERLLNIWDKLMNHLNMKKSFVVGVYGDTDKYALDGNIYNEVLYMFRNGNVLFTSSPSMSSIALLRDMEDDFGIIPFPHENEEAPGTAYGSYVNGIGQPFFVPVSNSNPARCGHVFEALCHEYYYNVIDKYLDDVAMTKQIRDENSSEMLKMMYSNKRVDISSGYWWEDTNQKMYDVFRSGTNTFVSEYKKIEKTSNKKIKKTVEMFMEFSNFGEN